MRVSVVCTRACGDLVQCVEWSRNKRQSFLPIYKISLWTVWCQPFGSHTWGPGMEQSTKFLGRDLGLHSQRSFSILMLYYYPMAQSCPGLKEGLPTLALDPTLQYISSTALFERYAQSCGQEQLQNLGAEGSLKWERWSRPSIICTLGLGSWFLAVLEREET